MENIIYLTIALAAGALGTAIYFVAPLPTWRYMRTIRRHRVADGPEGQPVRIVGAIAPIGAPLIAPLSGTPCVYYAAQLIQWRGKGSKILRREFHVVPFAVVDESGRALLDLTVEHFRYTAVPRTLYRVTSSPTPWEEAMLARAGQEPSPTRGWTHSYQFVEQALTIGTQVAVVGVGVREPDPDAVGAVRGYRDVPPTRLRLGPTSRGGPYVHPVRPSLTGP
ncbi:MAG: hypothetical protein R2939_21975 [Kofleriaceae bacterium]